MATAAALPLLPVVLVVIVVVVVLVVVIVVALAIVVVVVVTILMTVAVVVVVVIVIIVVLRAVTACLCVLFVRHSLNTRSRSRCEQWASGKAGRQTDQADLDLVAAGSRSGRTGASALRNMICVVDVTPCSTSQPFPTSAQALFGRRDALVRGAGCSCPSQLAV